MPTTLILPDGFQYTSAALVSTLYLLGWQSVLVGGARKAANVAYPQLYAEKAEQQASPAAMRFNCTQRAHQNTLEVIPMIYAGTLISSATNPTIAAGLCASWVVGRILYTLGYTTGDPKKRNSRGGILSSLSLGSMILYSTYSAVNIFRNTV